jgi:hypothetical protein
VGIAIEKTNAGIGIPASVISVRYRAKKCRTAQLYSGTGLFPASLDFFSPVPDCPDAGQSGIPAVIFIYFGNFQKTLFHKLLFNS